MQIDDYFFGDFRQLSPEKYKRNPTDQPRFSFHARKAQDRDAKQTQAALQKTADLLRSYNFTLGFGHHTKELYTGQPSNPMIWSAVTFALRNRSIKISLSTDRYQPLLRNDLSASERYAHEFYNAEVLVHEFMVSSLHHLGNHSSSLTSLASTLYITLCASAISLHIAATVCRSPGGKVR